MSIKNTINQPINIDSRNYNFDGEIKIKVNQFYKLDTAERLRILLLAEKTDEELKKINTTIDGIKNRNQTTMQEINDLKTAVGDLPTKTGNNVFTGSNTFGNLNFSGSLSYSNNLLFSFKYLNLGAGNQSVFHLGNANFPINLIAKDNKILLNGKIFENGGKVEVLFSGLLKIELPAGPTINDFGSIAEYSYQNIVNAKEYNFIYFKFESEEQKDFNLHILNGGYYSFYLLVSKNKTAIHGYAYGETIVKVNDSDKKIYVAHRGYGDLQPLCIKEIIIF